MSNDALDLQLIALIDQRIRSAQSSDKIMATIVQRDFTGPGCQVRFDNSTVAVPAKVLGHIHAFTNDRVTMTRYGVEWIVTGSFNTGSYGQKSLQVFAGGDGPLTSSTYVDLSSIGPFTFTKVYDETHLRMSISPSGFSATATNTSIRFGLRLTPTDVGSTYTPIDYELGFIFFSQTGMHMSGVEGSQRVQNIPHGTYACQIRWKRTQGTGSGNANTGDLFVIQLDELPPGIVPVE